MVRRFTAGEARGREQLGFCGWSQGSRPRQFPSTDTSQESLSLRFKRQGFSGRGWCKVELCLFVYLLKQQRATHGSSVGK